MTTYVDLVKRILASEEASVKVKMNMVFIHLAKAVTRSKVLPDRSNRDVGGSLTFLKDVVTKQMTEKAEGAQKLKEAKQDESEVKVNEENTGIINEIDI